MKASDEHWTSDPELIERFVLNQLNPDERNELEDHLRVCEVCKLAVRSEQVLLAGIRRSGRERFKMHLQQRLPERRPAIPWPHILSTAAIIVVLTGIGIYNRWFFTMESPEPGEVITEAPVPAEKDSRPSEISADAAKPKADEGAAVREQRVREQRTKDEGIQGQGVEDRVRHDEISTLKKSGPPSSEAQIALQESMPESAVVVNKSIAAGAATQMTEVAQAPQVIWLEGEILDYRVRSEELQSKPTYAAPRESKRQAAHERLSAVAEIQVTYRPTTLLSSAQQAAHKPLASVQRVGNQLLVELYTDASQSVAARGIQRGDSLIITAGTTLYVFRLTPTQQQVLQTPAR